MKNISKVDMKEFEKEYNKQYEFIYKNNMNNKTVAGESSALSYFNNDHLTDEEFYLLTKFQKHRMDILSSDREIIAFMFTVGLFI